jgi:integrase/recombinase XerD
MAAYGLRSCEVTLLTLDDIDWKAGVLSVPQSKTRNRLTLPLTDAAAATVIAYLKKRPQLPYRELFLRVHAPHGVLKPSAVSAVFRRWVRRSGLDIPFRGPHCIRHSYAVHLLRQGTSIKAIGDLLGHRTAESTCVYLRLALEDLRSVALPVPLKTSPVSCFRAKCPYSGQKREVMAPLRSPLRSILAEEIEEYLRLKRSLGRKFEGEATVLRSMDAFVVAQYPLSEDLTGEIFTQWCTILNHLSSTVRRRRMQVVRNFCLYRRRSRPHVFLPDPRSFPAPHQPSPPYIVSESAMGNILEATRYLQPSTSCPLRTETLRIAFLLLFTTGIRRGELLRLTLGDIDVHEGTVSIRETKFHKSRVIPLSPSVALELQAYLELRQKNRLPLSLNSPVVLSGPQSPEGRGYTGTGLARNWTSLCTSLDILTPKGRPPRIHDVRHSFAVNVLMGWYRNHEDAQAKLPLLSTYMGHVSIVSTHYYLTFTEGLRSEASTLFHRHFGEVVNPDHGGAR